MVGLFAKQVALNLDIKASTLRRWALELEKHGYQFARNEKDHRIYYEHDLVVLKDFQHTININNDTEGTAKLVVARFNERKNAQQALYVQEENSNQIALTQEDLANIINQTAEQTANAMMRKFADSVEQRDRQLMASLKFSLEQRQLELGASKVSWYKKLFGKKKNRSKTEGQSGRDINS